jgi:hypothetical protein
VVTFISENPGDSGTTAVASQGVTGPSGGATFAALIVGRTGGTGTGALTGVTDTSSNTWVVGTRGSVSGVSNTRVEIWYCENYTTATTVTFAGASQQSGWNILGFSGLLTASSLDVASPDNSSTASVTNPTTPSITTTAGGLVIGVVEHAVQDGTAPGSPWNALTSWSVNGTAAQGNGAYQITGAGGSYSATFSTTAAHQCGSITIGFLAAAGGGGGVIMQDLPAPNRARMTSSNFF